MIGEPSPLVVNHFICAQDKFNPDTNPAGKINLGTAENHLMDDEMLEVLNRPLDYSAQHLHYDIPHGTESFRAAIAGFMEEDLKISDILFENVVVACGASAILEALSMALFEEGEGLIVPTPCYTGFIHDFSTRFNVRLLPYALSPHNNYEFDIDDLKQVIEEAKQEGVVVRAILLCSPYNPLGITYPEQKLAQIVQTAKEYRLDIISDEIYAQSVYQGQFTSMLEIGKEYRQHIHFVYGFAKDFVLSGFKVGVFYSENKELVSAVKEIAYFHNVSTYTQWFLENLITNRTWRRRFTAENRVKLSKSYRVIKNLLKSELNINVIEANAGIFLWADFSNYLAEQTFEAELNLFNKIFQNCHVSISPGQFFQSNTPGWFRICFAQKEEHIKTGITRLKRMLTQQ